MAEKLRDMPWLRLRDWLSFTVHDDRRDVGVIYNNIEDANGLGADSELIETLYKLTKNLLLVHDEFKAFREPKKPPSKAEIDRYLLEYSGRLEHLSRHIVGRLKELQPIIEKVKSPELKKALLQACKKIHATADFGNTYNSMVVGITPRLRMQSLKSLASEYVRTGVRDREGRPVEVKVLGKDARAPVDRGFVQSSLANLLTDSINHTPGRPIFVRVGQRGKHAYISVTSQGNPLTREEKKKIGMVRYTRSQDPNRGWGKIAVRTRTEKQGGKFAVGNSKIGPRLEMRFPLTRRI